MYPLLDENGDDIEDPRALFTAHREALAEDWRRGPTALERARVRYLGEPGSPEYEEELAEVVGRRIASEEELARRAATRESALAQGFEGIAREARLLERSALARYEARLALWRGDASSPRPLGRLRHAGWWWLHNLLAHPLLGLVPCAATVRLHDWSSGRLSRRPPPTSLAPVIGARWRWLVHNVVVHAAIGLVPCAATFRWHDASAARLGVPGWV